MPLSGAYLGESVPEPTQTSAPRKKPAGKTVAIAALTLAAIAAVPGLVAILEKLEQGKNTCTALAAGNSLSTLDKVWFPWAEDISELNTNCFFLYGIEPTRDTTAVSIGRSMWSGVQIPASLRDDAIWWQKFPGTY